MKEVLGYDCKTLRVEDLEKRARELANIFKEIAKELGWTETPIYL
jgi:hypothetical protein